MLEQALLSPVLAVLNRMLAEQPSLRAELGLHAGKQVVFAVERLTLRFAIGSAGVLALGDAGRQPDVEVYLPAAALSRALDGLDAMQAQARVSGDAGLAELLPRLASSLRPDIGGWLSPMLGDIVANRVEQGFAALSAAGRRGLDGLTANLGEYLREEARLAVSAAEGQVQRSELEQLQGDLARVEARVARLAGA